MLNAAVTPPPSSYARDEAVRSLHEVGAEQQRFAPAQGLGQRGEELRAWLRGEVADGAPEERDHPVAGVGQLSEVVLEVAGHGVDGGAGVLGGDRGGGVAQRGFRHVERDEGAKPPHAAQSVEQDPGLLGCSRTELDERVGTARRDDRGGVRGEDGALRPGRVVLGQAGDPVEQLRSAVVVEPLGREILRHGGEPPARVGPERDAEVGGIEVGVHTQRRGGHRGPSRGVVVGPSAVTVSRWASGTLVQRGSSSSGSEATVVPSSS